MNVSPSCNTANPERLKFCLQCACSLATEKGKICPACKHAVPEGNRFCGQCGERIPQERRCASCKHLILEGSRFCGQCGAAIHAVSDAIPKPHPALLVSPGAYPPEVTRRGQQNGHLASNGKASDILPAADSSATTILDHFRSLMPTSLANKMEIAAAQTSGEQREVTVLFLDVTNFTAASHRMDSEDIYLIIDEAMRLLVEIVYKYEGTVDKFTGDGLIALFGAPVTHENDPERALRTSLEMLQVLQPLRQRTMSQHNFDFQVRIGVNTGLAIAGRLGSDLHMEYTVIGDTVNMASRLETAAQPGSVLVSFSTYQRTRPLFNFVTLPPVAMKGFPDPIRAYRPIQVREQPGSVRGLPGMRVQMIGRVEDMARLHYAMEVVKKERHHRISLITGDAGLGKSRLVVEFCESLARQNIRYFQGNCLAYARSRPMWVVAEMLRNIVHITEVDTADFQIEQLQAFIAEQSLNEAEVLPVLLHLLELETLQPADADEERVNGVLRKVLLSFQSAPFVLIFDDLHWVDPASRQFLIDLIRSSDAIPLHLILVARDFERLTVIRPIIEACAAKTETLDDIRLRALSIDESRLLVNQLVHQSSAEIEELNEMIVTRAEGNPFYTEEIVRMLMDKGGIIEQGVGWMPTVRARELLRAVPGTLRGLILARFDQLPSDLRYTLQQAAVLGRTFSARLLATLNANAMDALIEQMAELASRQFLQENTNSSERGFFFRHTLIQEAVYTTLLKRDRRRLHGVVAEMIKDTDFWLPQEQAEALAYHYTESDEPEKAIPYLLLTADGDAQDTLFETANRLLHPHHQLPVL